jgi:tetratricopeptide (TPR) repeat protein
VLVLAVLAAAAVAGWRYRVTRPDYRLARGEEAIAAKDWETVGYLRERLEASGHPDEAHLLRGRAHYARKRPDLALPEFDAVREDSPLRDRAAFGLGRCLLDLGARKEAAQAFLFVLEHQPDDADAHRGMAAVAYDLGQLGVAVEHLERVAELDPADARPHRLIGLIYKDMGQLPRAEAAYREALRRGLSAADEQTVRAELGEVLVRQGRFADALAALDAAAAPDNSAWVAARAEGLRGAGRQKEAAELLDRELGKHPDPPLYRVRGQIYLEQGNYAEAARLLERAAELDPADHQAHYLLAQAYTGLGRKDDAARESARVEELRKDFDLLTALTREAMDRPWDAAVRLRLAETCRRLGMAKLAEMWRAAAAACARK